MSFRRRLTLAAAGAVAVAVVLASVAAWFVVRRQLRGEVDEQLQQRAAVIRQIPLRVADGNIEVPPPLLGQRTFFMQIVTPDGEVVRTADSPDIHFVARPPTEESALFDRRVEGTHYRVYTERIAGFTLTLALPLTDVDASLRRLAFILLIVTGGGIALAVALGGGVTAAAAAPVARLTEAAERVTETGDLSLRIEDPPSPGDEIGRLATSFNGMLAALESSVNAQKQLVADASHELRTPITSIRTNIDVLASGAPLEAGERERLLVDVRGQLEELTTIVNDLVELARDGQQPAGFGDVRLDEVVGASVEAFRRHVRDSTVVTDLEPSVVIGNAARIDRAVRNLLDNAAKWSAPGTEIVVTVRDGVVTVRDHGPGFPNEDLPHVFDRFYRSTAARSKPGSGLGLAIVRQVLESHGGRVTADNAEDGGAVVRLEFPPPGEELPPPP
ncbi:MAG: HAMP domain-containing sensor histidine kinase [Actinomycetota bacterium]